MKDESISSFKRCVYAFHSLLNIFPEGRSVRSDLIIRVTIKNYPCHHLPQQFFKILTRPRQRRGGTQVYHFTDSRLRTFPPKKMKLLIDWCG
jgi:hypothetical protein